MLSVLAKAVDKTIMRMAERMMKGNLSGEGRLAEASALLKHPDFFCDFATAPPLDFTFSKNGKFSFTSTYGNFPQVNIVRGKLYSLSEAWEKKPTVVLIHGWNGENGARFLFPLIARRLNGADVNAIMFELPFHGSRKPPGNKAAVDFISCDLERMINATRQSIADTRSLVGWLKAQGCPWIGIWGFSLGAWIGGLVACADSRISSAVLLTPITRIDSAIETLPFCEPIRAGLSTGDCLQLEELNLKSHTPKIPPNRILIVKGEYDLFAAGEAVEELWLAWGKPHIKRYRAGHISILFSPFAVGRTTAFILSQVRCWNSS